jgi:perosamine synthetase
MDAINHIAGIHGLWVVEDAAEAHLAKYKDRPVGSLCPIATFSFYGNKIFTSGEGGALTLSGPNLELRLRTLRGQGMDPQRRYFFPVTGYNFRLTNIAAALLCAQLERREQIMTRRRDIFTRYREALTGIPGIKFQPVAPWARPAPWLYSITVHPEEYGRSRDELAAILSHDNVDTRPFFLSLHQLPPFREGSRQRNEKLPHTEALSATGLNLPTFTMMTDDQIAGICQVIRRSRR